MHVSLDSALGRQRRLNSVGESVLQIAPSAAAAYSLRRLTGGDPKVVRVRRGSDNHEQDFTASGVSSGALTSFVNAQVVAPLDIQALSATGRDGDFLIAKAAYSLRSLGTRQATLGAIGDTVARAPGKFVAQVRRSSDDALKSFTADEVTDGTLLSFVNEIQTVGTAVNGTGSVDNYTVSNLSTTGFSADNSAGGTGSAGFPYVFGDDDVIIVKYTVTNFSSTSSLSPQIRGVSATNSVNTVAGGGTAFTANGTYTDTLTATADGTHLMFADGNTGSYTISDFEIVSHSSNGFVKTWYDQSVTNQAGDTATGNHAVQATAGSQPKIVEAGSLLADGLTFDGSDDKLDIPNDLIASINSASSFLVAKSNTLSGSRIALALSHSTSNFRFYSGALLSSKFHFGYQNTALKIELSSADTNKHLFTSIAGSSNAEGFLDGTSKGTASSVDGKSTLSSGGIGAINTGNFWSGTIEEVVVYDTDQSDNRTAIEANIGEAYSIDLPSGVDPGFDQVDGFVETWYDQSGNGNDVTQATSSKQPKIVNAGSLVTVGSKASLNFDGSDDFLERETYTQGTLSQPNTFFAVAKLDVYTDTGRKIFDSHNSSARNILFLSTAGNGQFAHFAGTTQATGEDADADRHLFTSLINGASSSLRIDTAEKTTANPGTQDMTGIVIAANNVPTSTFWDGDIQELIIYNSDQTANRPAIEANINNQYDIY